ncbi:hypothetical protein O181_017612 [Austropuccinia psidii MF-1]|uniref:Uncharacterized protein n=1 Tax=Austropuccinia psidii MF-1 TaxID=1389203 RepID=A0A9Q3GSQ9_9BASI|nr:hypothetical protein [Austropuccinia psidii MF-1]
MVSLFTSAIYTLVFLSATRAKPYQHDQPAKIWDAYTSLLIGEIRQTSPQTVSGGFKVLFSHDFWRATIPLISNSMLVPFGPFILHDRPPMDLSDLRRDLFFNYLPNILFFGAVDGLFSQHVSSERATLTKRSLRNPLTGARDFLFNRQITKAPEELAKNAELKPPDINSDLKLPSEYQLVEGGSEIEHLTLPPMHVRMRRYLREVTARASLALGNLFRKLSPRLQRSFVPYYFKDYSLSTGAKMEPETRQAFKKVLKSWSDAYSKLFSNSKGKIDKNKVKSANKLQLNNLKKEAEQLWIENEKQAKIALKTSSAKHFANVVENHERLNKLRILQYNLERSHNSRTETIDQIIELFPEFDRKLFHKAKKEQLNTQLLAELDLKFKQLKAQPLNAAQPETNVAQQISALTQRVLPDYQPNPLEPPPPAVFAATELFSKLSSHEAYRMNLIRDKWVAEYSALQIAPPKSPNVVKHMHKIHQLKEKWSQSENTYILLTKVEVMRELLRDHLTQEIVSKKAFRKTRQVLKDLHKIEGKVQQLRQQGLLSGVLDTRFKRMVIETTKRMTSPSQDPKLKSVPKPTIAQATPQIQKRSLNSLVGGNSQTLLFTPGNTLGMVVPSWQETEALLQQIISTIEYNASSSLQSLPQDSNGNLAHISDTTPMLSLEESTIISDSKRVVELKILSDILHKLNFQVHVNQHTCDRSEHTRFSTDTVVAGYASSGVSRQLVVAGQQEQFNPEVLPALSKFVNSRGYHLEELIDLVLICNVRGNPPNLNLSGASFASSIYPCITAFRLFAFHNHLGLSRLSGNLTASFSSFKSETQTTCT